MNRAAILLRSGGLSTRSDLLSVSASTVMMLDPTRVCAPANLYSASLLNSACAAVAHGVPPLLTTRTDVLSQRSSSARGDDIRETWPPLPYSAAITSLSQSLQTRPNCRHVPACVNRMLGRSNIRFARPSSAPSAHLGTRRNRVIERFAVTPCQKNSGVEACRVQRVEAKRRESARMPA